jgi:UDP-N-acetylglucosamine acyltransferase
LADSIQIGPFAVIEGGVEIGKGTRVEAHAIIRTGVMIGEHCVVDCHAVIGGLPQDPRIDPGIVSGVQIGNKVVLREGVTRHRGSKEGMFTRVGNNCYIMANAHVAHDCQIGENVTIANGVLLAGHVHIGTHAFLGGAAAFHQFARVGESAMISGLSRVSRDAPPFCMVAERDELIGLNLVGLKRRGKSLEVIRALKSAFREAFRAEGRLRERVEVMLAKPEYAFDEVQGFLSFLLEAKRGLPQLRRNESRNSKFTTNDE